MTILRNPYLAFGLGAAAAISLGLVAAQLSGPTLATTLALRIEGALAGTPVRASFVSANGFATRHPVLSGGEQLDDTTRTRIARAVGAVPAVGGIRWADGDARAVSAAAPVEPLHCQQDVNALLRARTIRFEESSARIEAPSRELIDEVAAALRPCLGSIISISGHTDASGPEPGNLALSRERAEAVRAALVERGIPADGLRTRGLGSRDLVTGLEPEDPANRRIEFAVIATQPVRPTPVDTPGPR